MLATKLSDPANGLFRRDHQPVEWAVSPQLVAYEDAVSAMEARAAAVALGQQPELVWLLQHPPLYTAGVSAKLDDLIQPDRFPVHASGRGGQYTYHGPGQRVAYVMLDLSARSRDVRAFVIGLEAWIIETLRGLGVTAGLKPGRVGVWVDRPGPDGRVREDKIAAIGVKIRRWVSFHGVSINIDPDLDHFVGIVPCGIREHGVTSLRDLGRTDSMARSDEALQAAFHRMFGPTTNVEPPG